MSGTTPPHATPTSSALPCPLPPARVRTRPPAPPPLAPEPLAAPPIEASSYDVGYKKPPTHSRFKPGQSGNPKGRPRGAKGLNTLARETLTKKVGVRTASGEVKMTRMEAVLYKVHELAMKGNARAIAELLKLYANAVPDTSEAREGHGPQEEEALTDADLFVLAALRQSQNGAEVVQ